MPRSLESSGELRVRLGDSALAPMCDPEREMGPHGVGLRGGCWGVRDERASRFWTSRFWKFV